MAVPPLEVSRLRLELLKHPLLPLSKQSVQFLLGLRHHLVLSLDESIFHLHHLTVAALDRVFEPLNLRLDLLAEVRVLNLLEG